MLEPTPGDPNALSGGGGGPKKGLFERVKAILMSPKTEWGVIDAEPATVGSIYMSYVLILAAIGPIATLIGHQVFGMGLGIKPSMEFTIAWVVIMYILSLVSVYLNALIIDALAPSFGGTKDMVKAFKVAAYSATAAWLAGIFGIFPMLAILGILGLYSLYLLYLGLPRLMRVAEDKAMGYTVVVIVVWIIIYAVCIYLVSMLVLMMVGPMVVAPVMIRY